MKGLYFSDVESYNGELKFRVRTREFDAAVSYEKTYELARALADKFNHLEVESDGQKKARKFIADLKNRSGYEIYFIDGGQQSRALFSANANFVFCYYLDKKRTYQEFLNVYIDNDEKRAYIIANFELCNYCAMLGLFDKINRDIDISDRVTDIDYDGSLSDVVKRVQIKQMLGDMVTV